MAARAPHADIVHLCGASELDRLVAVARAARPASARLHDVGRDAGAVILQQLSEDVGRIAAILASLSDEEAAAAAWKPVEDAQNDEAGIDAATIRAMIRARRLRDQYFRGDLFADPAWDMLLDLMAARIEKNRVAVSSLCIAAAVPATTALRWIKALTDRGCSFAPPIAGRAPRLYRAFGRYGRGHSLLLRALQRISPTAV